MAAPASTMVLLIRLVRALTVFGLILVSYVAQLAIHRATRRFERDPGGRRGPAKTPRWVERRRRRVDARNAGRLLRGTLGLRGVYIKLGQILSVMGGFLPRVYCDELSVLQDRVPPQPFHAMRKVFRKSLGKRLDECFERIDPEPIAAASLGQVHAARLWDGRKVAVKFLYPGIRGVIRTDMRVIGLALRVYKWFMPFENIESVHVALVDLLRRETDYLHEAACMERMAENFREQPDILFPVVVHELTTMDILTMTFMEGFKITDVDEMRARGIDPHRVATRITQSFYEQLFVHRFFHADPHPGNFLVAEASTAEEPRVVVLDFGAICEVGEEMVEGMVDVLQGFFEQEDSLVLKGFERLGFVSAEGNRALVEKTVLTYFRKLLKVEDRTVGGLMRANAQELEMLADPEVERQQLRELMRSIHYPDGWFYVERASVLAFWLVGRIDPDLDTLQVGFPYVMPLLAERARQRGAAQA